MIFAQVKQYFLWFLSEQGVSVMLKENIFYRITDNENEDMILTCQSMKLFQKQGFITNND